ncbi:MAG: undecaprenyl-diphosphate phosphatase [Dehalococcoidia bacterium]
MTILQGLILGAVQGIAEWLPVSSKGIVTLILVNFFGLQFREAFYLAVWLHAGTLLAAVFYFRRELWEMIKSLPAYIRDLRHPGATGQGRLITFLIIGTAVTAAVGGPLILFSLDNLELGGVVLTAVIGLFLIITGLVQRFALKSAGFADKPLRILDAVWVGLAQALSAFPGFSRSGMSISALLFLRYSGGQALRLCFLLSMPIILVAEIGLGLLQGITLNEASVAGLLSAAVFGFLTIGALMKVAVKLPFWIFCVALGLLSLAPWLAGLWVTLW